MSYFGTETNSDLYRETVYCCLCVGICQSVVGLHTTLHHHCCTRLVTSCTARPPVTQQLPASKNVLSQVISLHMKWTYMVPMPTEMFWRVLNFSHQFSRPRKVIENGFWFWKVLEVEDEGLPIHCSKRTLRWHWQTADCRTLSCCDLYKPATHCDWRQSWQLPKLATNGP